MKHIAFVIVSCFSLQIAIAKKTKFSIGVDGNVSFFRGHEAGSAAFILLSDVPGPASPDVTLFPYGKKPESGGSAYINIQRTGKKRWIAGLSAGYELLASKIKITQVEGRFGYTPADGTSKLTHTFINLFPYIGKRFGSTKTGGFIFDADLGLDLGIMLSAHEKGETQISGSSTVITDFNHKKLSVDYRPRLQFRLQKNHIGLQSSFSAGITNYFGYSTLRANSNIFRLGIFYTL